ncbi:MAG TPA: cytochrome P450 [Acidimicrobiales bacterium]|nr:cytochrome P450 [Acidimicrobiales bacterium]
MSGPSTPSPTPPDVVPLSGEWCAHHFDHRSHELGQHLHETMARMRAQCPVAHSDAHGGFWVVTRYEDVLGAAQDWRTFSSAAGVAVPSTQMVLPAIPEHLDPPLQRVFKRLINAYFTPAVVSEYEAPTRRIVTRLIDAFVEAGECEFMEAFARPLPGLAFFELVLNAPPEEVADVNALASGATNPSNPDVRACWEGLIAWIEAFVERRRAGSPKGDVVDAVLNAEIEGRPITHEEILGTIQLLILGGLDTTAGALGQFVMRFAVEPAIPGLLRRRPELLADAVEELLRLEGPFVGIGRTTTCATEIDGHAIGQGEKVIIYFTSANRDEAEFPHPDEFDLDRERNRHLTFGAGPHRCAGSNLARLNLRISVSEIVRRLPDLALGVPAEEIQFHSVFNRAPLAVPITFRPGAREGAAG